MLGFFLPLRHFKPFIDGSPPSHGFLQPSPNPSCLLKVKAHWPPILYPALSFSLPGLALSVDPSPNPASQPKMPTSLINATRSRNQPHQLPLPFQFEPGRKERRI